MWRSLVARVVRDDEVAVPTPPPPTVRPGPGAGGFVVPAVFLLQAPSQIPSQTLAQILLQMLSI